MKVARQAFSGKENDYLCQVTIDEICHKSVYISLVTQCEQGNYPQAEMYLQRGIDSARRIGLPQMEANARNEYGNFFLDQQKVAMAEDQFNEALAITPVECRNLRALAQYGLARAALAQGDVQRAQQLGTASITTVEKTGHYKAQEVRTWLENLPMR